MPIPYRNKHSKCIFLNVLPHLLYSFPFVTEKPLNLTTIEIAEDYDLVFPKDYWLWDEENADKQFLSGYLAAKSHTPKI